MVTYCSSLIFLKWLLSFHLLVCGGVFHLTLSDILRYFIFCTIFKCCLMSRCFILLLVVFILEMVSGASLILFFLVILHKYQFYYISQFYLLNHFSHPLNSQSAELCIHYVLAINFYIDSKLLAFNIQQLGKVERQLTFIIYKELYG